MKKTGYSLEQHDQLGQELQAMRDRLTVIVTELSQAYPLKLAGLAKKPLEQIDRLRCELDNIVCRENPGREDAIRIYYRANRSDYHRPEQSQPST